MRCGGAISLTRWDFQKRMRREWTIVIPDFNSSDQYRRRESQPSSLLTAKIHMAPCRSFMKRSHVPVYGNSPDTSLLRTSSRSTGCRIRLGTRVESRDRVALGNFRSSGCTSATASPSCMRCGDHSVGVVIIRGDFKIDGHAGIGPRGSRAPESNTATRRPRAAGDSTNAHAPGHAVERAVIPALEKVFEEAQGESC